MNESEDIAKRIILERADLEFIRVLDDLIELLCRKQVISLEDFPEDARRKIFERQQLRAE